jgi:hypothetical protein
VTGGPEPYDIDLAIEGDFGLVSGYEYSTDPDSGVPTIHPYAQFVDVDAILFNPLSMAPMPVPGWDLDETLHLTSLDGTFQAGDPMRLFFNGVDGQGQSIELEGTLHGRHLHLSGENRPCCSNLYHYQVDALAYLKPYPDWNFDDAVDAADYVALRKTAGIDEDYGVWELEFGANMPSDELGSSLLSVPEPAAFALLLFCALTLPDIAIRGAATRASV